jgi:hypothetical protein
VLEENRLRLDLKRTAAFNPTRSRIVMRRERGDGSGFKRPENDDALIPNAE